MLLLVDANVLIDFVEADRRVLALVVNHVGPVHVPRDVLGRGRRRPVGAAAVARAGRCGRTAGGDAVAVAQAIGRANQWMSASVVEAFVRKLGGG